MALETLGTALGPSHPEEALPVFQANFVLTLRHDSNNSRLVFGAQCNLANCLELLGQCDEALVLKREVYAKTVAAFGVSDEESIHSGSSLATLLITLRHWEEAKLLFREQLLPVARPSLGADHHTTLALNQNLAMALQCDPEGTRDDPRLNQRRSVDATR